jgi:hypothetical protein
VNRTLVVCLLSMVAACDPLAKGDFRPAYVTINGVIDGSTAVEMPSRVHIALLWQNDATPGSNYGVQFVDVVAQFPAAFAVPVNLPPQPQVIDTLQPGQALGLGVDPAMSWAAGTLVVYADENSNGKLDVVGPNDPPSPDRVLAATTDLSVWALLSGRPAASDLVGIFPVSNGFSLVYEPPRRDPEPGECGHFDAHGHFSDLCPTIFATPSMTDPSALVEHLTLTDDPSLRGFTCNTYWGPGEYPDWDQTNGHDVCDGGACRFCRGYQCPLDLPGPGDWVKCSADNLSYVYKHCAADASLCGTNICHFGHGELQATDPVPAGWPCH